MSNFKIAVLAIFSICFVVGIILFAMYKAGGGEQSYNITVWGTIPQDSFSRTYQSSSLVKNKLYTVSYVQKNQNTFDAEFVDALAQGKGPDIVLLRDDSIYKNLNKLLVIPFKNYPERTFKDTFIEGGEVFLNTDGVIAVPFMIDPMVMYWNRDIFSNNLIAQTPKYWDEMYGLIKSTTVKDKNNNILKSTISFGEWNNVSHAKELISLLFLQAGTPIVSYEKPNYVSKINSQMNYTITPGLSALNFYTQFSNPTNASYTWNRSLPSSQNFFLAGNLAMYFGFASELFAIQQKNPNLNFDVSYVPQIRDTKKKINYAHIYGFAVVKQSQQVVGDLTTIFAMTEASSLKTLEIVTNLPPVRRDLLSSLPTDAYRAVFYNSALISHSWIDPDANATANIFRDMIESITSGQSGIIESLGTAHQSISSLLQK